jgi:hypothetical protein
MANDDEAVDGLYIYTYTLWLFNIAMAKSPFLIGKPSISMGHLYHGELLVITRG